ncbi:hypothetical protein FIBSPDRAFT_849999 [Athelia psychrophila]|uniref:Uncharacterized protein n=1 Tax=Athelia psychrophila TaxID=1759441 RepID=A0A166TTI8_9AGAM|nr:hypothetical protein FIBSPDRAFT_849999 [Fibularhizoctonia sp. CBS 109695]
MRTGMRRGSQGSARRCLRGESDLRNVSPLPLPALSSPPCWSLATQLPWRGQREVRQMQVSDALDRASFVLCFVAEQHDVLAVLDDVQPDGVRRDTWAGGRDSSDVSRLEGLMPTSR